jgi:hypothetical protein
MQNIIADRGIPTFEPLVYNGKGYNAYSYYKCTGMDHFIEFKAVDLDPTTRRVTVSEHGHLEGLPPPTLLDRTEAFYNIIMATRNYNQANLNAIVIKSGPAMRYKIRIIYEALHSFHECVFDVYAKFCLDPADQFLSNSTFFVPIILPYYHIQQDTRICRVEYIFGMNAEEPWYGNIDTPILMSIENGSAPIIHHRLNINDIPLWERDKIKIDFHNGFHGSSADAERRGVNIRVPLTHFFYCNFININLNGQIPHIEHWGQVTLRPTTNPAPPVTYNAPPRGYIPYPADTPLPPNSLPGTYPQYPGLPRNRHLLSPAVQHLLLHDYFPMATRQIAAPPPGPGH